MLLWQKRRAEIKKLMDPNKALLAKWCWRSTREDKALWKDISQAKYKLNRGGCTTKKIMSGGAALWRTLRQEQEEKIVHTGFNAGKDKE